MKTKPKITIILICLVFLTFFSAALAETKDPLSLVRTTIDLAKQTVIDKKSKLSEDQLKLELENIIRPAFDFREMAKKCLGSNWKEGNPEQQGEFVDLFSALLSRTYMNKVTKGIEESTFSFPEEKIEGDKALIKTKITNKGDEITVDYRMQFTEGKWTIYDVIIENIGLISNYRTEFSGIIRKEGFAGLILRLREKKLN